MKNIFISLLLTIMISFIGCTAKDYCADPETKPIVLCAAANKLEVELGDVATALKLGNVSGLATNIYTAQEALDFIDECLVYLEEAESLTYKTLVDAILAKHGTLPATVQALFIIFDNPVSLTIPELNEAILTGHDINLLVLHLQKQRVIVLPFLAE